MMVYVTNQLIDELIADLSKPDAFPEQDTGISQPKGEVIVAEAANKLLHIPHSGRGFK